jgi:hypothetical protein
MVWSVNLLIPAIIGSLIIGTTTRKNTLDTDDQFVPTGFRSAVAEQSTGS